MKVYPSIPNELQIKQKYDASKSRRIFQVQLEQELHTRLKTMMSSANIFLREFAALFIMQILKNFAYVARSEKAISKKEL